MSRKPLAGSPQTFVSVWGGRTIEAEGRANHVFWRLSRPVRRAGAIRASGTTARVLLDGNSSLSICLRRAPGLDIDKSKPHATSTQIVYSSLIRQLATISSTKHVYDKRHHHRSWAIWHRHGSQNEARARLRRLYHLRKARWCGWNVANQHLSRMVMLSS